LRLDGHEIEVVLEEPVYAISLGQSVVFYAADVTLGGGVIARSKRALPVRAA
jgi:tRNA U34 2-thiouridine synthase MnmA/TrmU